MYYTAQIYDPTIGLDQIFAAASKFNTERFLYALQYKNWDEKSLELMGNEVATYRMKLEVEYGRLVEFSKVFNKEFVTMNNKCFSRTSPFLPTSTHILVQIHISLIFLNSKGIPLVLADCITKCRSSFLY